MARNYETVLLNTGYKEKAKKVRKLYERNADDIESIAFYAKVLIDEKQPEAAHELLQRGLNIREAQSLCFLMSKIDDKIAWENRTMQAQEDKIWHCRITNHRYADWQPYSDSGELNTIVWGFPPQGSAAPKTALAHNDFLFIS